MIAKKVFPFLLCVCLLACSRVPLSGRRQLNMLPENTLIDMSLNSYRQFLSKTPPVANTIAADQIQRVGNKVSSAVVQYFSKMGNAKRIHDYKWEFNLVNDKTINAWCMPGGKVVVYSGLLPVTSDDAGLAYVMGHEIAHAVARHGNERMSQILITQMGGLALQMALSEKSTETQAALLTAYGVGTTVGVILPFSRMHESEADRLGMVFMAMAGYQPAKAIETLERMQKATGKSGVPEFLSTHPSHANRINEAKAFLPQAEKYLK